MTTYDLTSSSPSKIKTGDIINCPYSGTYKQITLPKGVYKLEVWGAQGGYYSGRGEAYAGRGGYSYGTLSLQQETTLYLYSGEHTGTTGGRTTYAFNGGGCSQEGEAQAWSGGGASDISLNGGDWNSNSHLYSRIIVAGGGGANGDGTKYSNNGSRGGYGGGVSGGPNYNYNGSTVGYSSLASATAGAVFANPNGPSDTSMNGSFGIGGKSNNQSGYNKGAGGGGWYGGCGQGPGGSGSGGSGYVYTSSTASNYPSGCLLNSSYYLTNASTVAGNTSFTSPSGSQETGHSGNGYCRITVIDAGTSKKMYIKINGQWMELF